MPEQTYIITAYRDADGYTWVMDHHDRWYASSQYEQVPAGALLAAVFNTVDELAAARGPLVAVGVDNVEALLAENARLNAALIAAEAACWGANFLSVHDRDTAMTAFKEINRA